MHVHTHLITERDPLPSLHPLFSLNFHLQQREMPAIGGGIFWSVFILLFACSLHAVTSSTGNGTTAAEEGSASADMVPLVEAEVVMMMMNESRRKLNSFQICSMCTCCGGASRSICLPTPCCYAINCNIPNRPFGFCSFTPKTCNCFGCHL